MKKKANPTTRTSLRPLGQVLEPSLALTTIGTSTRRGEFQSMMVDRPPFGSVRTTWSNVSEFEPMRWLSPWSVRPTATPGSVVAVALMSNPLIPNSRAKYGLPGAVTVTLIVSGPTVLELVYTTAVAEVAPFTLAACTATAMAEDEPWLRLAAPARAAASAALIM